MGQLTETEENKRREIIDWALKQEGTLLADGNSVNAERLFLANSVVIWCIKQIREKKLESNEAQGYIFFVKKYVEGVLDLSWHNGVLYVGAFDE